MSANVILVLIKSFFQLRSYKILPLRRPESALACLKRGIFRYFTPPPFSNQIKYLYCRKLKVRRSTWRHRRRYVRPAEPTIGLPTNIGCIGPSLFPDYLQLRVVFHNSGFAKLSKSSVDRVFPSALISLRHTRQWRLQSSVMSR